MFSVTVVYCGMNEMQLELQMRNDFKVTILNKSAYSQLL